MKVAYLVNQYPKVSHSFIRREIAALEAHCVEVLRYSIRRVDEQLVDDADLNERERTSYVLDHWPLGLLGATSRMKLTRMGRYIQASRSMWRMARRSESGLGRHLVYLMEACWLSRRLLAEGVDHLHAHFGTNAATVAKLVHDLTDIPYSFTVHGPEEFDKPHALSIGEKIEHAAFVAAVSSYGRSQLFRWCGHEHWPKIHVVHCGLDRGFFEREPAPMPDAPRFVCLGRLCEQKGQLLLVEAARRLAQNGADFELVLIGDGELRKPIEGLIATHGLGDRVTITGWQSGDQVVRWINDSRALVLPSFAEGLPVAIMEALALGRPVISTYIAGIPELVNRGCGLLIPAGSVDHLVEAMRVVLDTSPNELMQMGAVGVQRVRQRHDVSVEAGKLAALFADRPMPEGPRQQAAHAGVLDAQGAA